jgi:hypothetical protein
MTKKTQFFTKQDKEIHVMSGYAQVLENLRGMIQRAQYKALSSMNKELISI